MQEVKEQRFKKLMVSFDEKGYQKAVDSARDKLEILTRALKWIRQYVNDDKINMQLFSDDMLNFFLDRLVENNKEITKLGIIKPDKIADLLGINLMELSSIQQEYEDCKGVIKFVKGVARENVNEEDYKIYTTNEQQNAEYKLAEKVIHILKQAEEHCNINKHMVRQTFGQLIYWNPVENDYHYNINKF